MVDGDCKGLAQTGKPGPRSESGKARVRLNPLKHGVLAQTPVIPLVEREEDWERLKKGIREYYGVEGTMEEELADIISESIWRRKRAIRFETESIAAYLDDVPEDYRRLRDSQGWGPDPHDGDGSEAEDGPHGLDRQAVAEMDRMLTARLMPGAETLEKVIRYETKVNRTMFQAIHQLLVLQAIRKGTPPPPMPSGGRRSRKMRPTETQTGSVVGLAQTGKLDKRASLVGLGSAVEEVDGEGEAEEEGVLREGHANRAERRRIERRQRKAAHGRGGPDPDGQAGGPG